MGKKFFLLMAVFLSAVAALGYSVDTTHPPFYFEERTNNNGQVIGEDFSRIGDGAGWLQGNTIYNVTNHDLTATSEPNFYRIAIEKPGVAVRCWGLSTSQDIGNAVWFDNTASTNYLCSYNDDYKSAEKVYLYVWLKWMRYNVRFESNGGDPVDPIDGNCYTNAITLPSTARTGYDFDGWTNRVLTSALIGDNTGSGLQVHEDGETVVLYAKWKPKKFTVTFIPNGDGAEVSPASMQVTYDSAYGSLPKPTRPSYAFAGWFTEANAGMQIHSNTVVSITADQTLYAQWHQLFTVTFQSASGTVYKKYTDVEYGASVVPPDDNVVAVPEGSVLVGWIPDEYRNVTRNLTIYPDFRDVQTRLNVTCDSDKGLYSLDTHGAGPYDYGRTVTITVTPKAAYDFTGWDDGVSDNPRDVRVIADTNLVAQFALKRFTVDFMDWDGQTLIDSTTVDYGSAAVAPDPPDHVGHAFTSWSVDFSNVTSNVTTFAQYAANRYVVAYDANGGVGDHMTNEVFTYGVEYNLQSNAYTHALGTFCGWSSTPDATPSEVEYADGVTVSNLTTVANGTNILYAVWSSLLSDLSIAADCTNLILTCANENQRWVVDGTTGYASGASVRAAGNRLSKMAASGVGPGTLSFWLKTETSNPEMLPFNLVANGVVVVPNVNTSGDWKEYVYCAENTGGVSFEWSFTSYKDEDGGDYFCWVDQVHWYQGKMVAVVNDKVSTDDKSSIISAILRNWDAILGENAESVTLAKATGPGVTNAVEQLDGGIMPSFVIAGTTATLTFSNESIAKVPVEVPAITSKEYTGSLQVADVPTPAPYRIVRNEGGTDAGSYSVELALTNTARYCWTGGNSNPTSLTFTITKAANEWLTEPSVAGWEYGQAANEPNLGNARFGTASVTYGSVGTACPTDAGNYTATFTVAETANYSGLSKTVEFVIAKAANEWKKVPSIAGWTYGQAANAPDFGEAKFGTASVTYLPGQKTQPPQNAGRYTATFMVAETVNYGGLSTNVAFTISKATYNMTGVVWNGLDQYTYRGTPYEVTLKPNCLPDGVTVSYSGNSGTDVGSYTATATFDYDFGNYNAPSAMHRNWEIVPRNIAAATVTLGPAIVYNGNEQEQTVTGVTVDGLDVSTFEVSGNKAKDPGTYMLTVTGTGNFTGSATKEWKIRQNEIVANVASYDGIYDGDGHGIAVTVTKPEGAVVRYACAIEGPYAVPPILFTNVTDGAVEVWYTVEAANYETVTNNGTVKISPKTLTADMVTFEFEECLYDGMAKKPTVTVKDGEPSIISESDYDVAYSNNVDVGTADVIVTAKGNYTGIVTEHFTIRSIEEEKLEEILYGMPVTVEPDGSGGWKVTVTNDIDAADLPIEFPANLGAVTIDIKGHSLTGGAGQAAIRIVPGEGDGVPTVLTIATTGGDATVQGGVGQPAIKVVDGVPTGVAVNIGAGVTVKGGGDDVPAAIGEIGTNEGTIVKVDVAVPVIKSKVYTGTLQTATVPDSYGYRVVQNAGGTIAGDYPVTLELADPGNYRWEGGDSNPTSLTFTITKAVNGWITEPSIAGWIEGESPSEPNMGEAKFGAVSVMYGAQGGTMSPSLPDGSGDYVAVFTVEGTGNYSGLTKEVPFDIVSAERLLSYAADCTNLLLVCDAPTQRWEVDSTAGHESVSSVKAAGSFMSSMKTGVNGSGTITFWVKAYSVSPEGVTNVNTDIDRPVFRVEFSSYPDKKYDVLDTAGEWKALAFEISGDTTVEWKSFNYKDDNIIGEGDGNDYYCWVDQVHWHPGKSVTVESDTMNDEGKNAIIAAVLQNWNAIFAGEEASSVIRAKATGPAIANAMALMDRGVMPSWRFNEGSTTIAILTFEEGGIVSKDPVVVPVIASAEYTGELQVADVSDSELYRIVRNDGGTTAGVYSVELALADETRYCWAGGDSSPTSLTFTITKAANGWSQLPSVEGWRYGQPTNAPYMGEAKFGAASVMYSDAPQDAGSYTATFTVPGTADYDGLTKTVEFTITKAVNGWTQMPSIKGWTYGENPKEPDLGEAKFGTVSVAYSAEPQNAGDYTATFSVPETVNYKGLSKTVAFAIAKAANVWTREPAITGWTYGQTACVPDLGEARFGTASVTYSAEPHDAGSYTATFIVTETVNYAGLSKVVNFIISRATYDMSGARWSAGAFTYDGTEKRVVVEGLPSGVTVQFYANNAKTAAGNYTATATLAYDDAVNYNTPSAISPCEWSIARKNIAGATVTLGPPPMYTGENRVQEVTGVTVDGINVTYTVSGNMAIEIGTYTLTVTGTGNFTGTATKEWQIRPEGIVEVVTPYDGIYDGGGHGIKVEVMKPEEAVVKYAIVREGPYAGEEILFTNVTDGAVEVWYTVEAENYATVTNSGTVKISPKTLTDGMVELEMLSCIYDGTAKRPKVTVKDGEPSIILESDYDVAYSNNVDVGSADVIVTAKGNYTGTVTAHFEIRAKVDVAVPAINAKEYTGALQTAIVPVDDRYVVTQNDGGTEAGTYPVVLLLSDPGNYRWAGGDSNPTSLTFTITKAANAWITEPSIAGWMEGESPSKPNMGEAKFGAVSVMYGAQGGTMSPSLPDGPGEYVAVFTVDGTGNYSGLTKNVAFTISRTSEEPNLDKVFAGLPAKVEPDGNGGWKVTLTNGIDSADLPIEIPDNLGPVTVDINGHELVGEDGKPAIRIVHDEGAGAATQLTVANGGMAAAVKGGNGSPAIEAVKSAQDGVKVNIGENVTLKGGDVPAIDDALIGTNDGDIEKVEVAVPGIAGAEYTGEPQMAEVPVSALYATTQNDGGTEAGAYPVVLSLADPGNYRWAGGDSNPTSLTFTIAKAANAWITEPSIAGWTQGETPSEPNMGAAKFGEVGVMYGVQGSTMSPSLPDGPGEYVAVFSVPDTVNWTGVTKEIPFEITLAESESADWTLKVGEYFKMNISALGYDVPTNGTPYSVVAKGLPAGLKLKYNAAVKKGKKITKKAKSEWWIEGVPTAALDYFTNPPYLVINVGGNTETYALSMEVLAQDVTDLGEFQVGTVTNAQYFLPGVTKGWTVSGLPTGLKYTAKKVTKKVKSGKKTVVQTVALPYSVYGKMTKAGLFTITAKKKVGGYYETLKFRMIVLPKVPDAAVFGELPTNITMMAQEKFEWDLVKGGGQGLPTLPGVGKMAKVTGLPKGLTFAAATTYADKKKKKVKQYGQTIAGTPTKPGTYLVTFTKNVKSAKKTAQILWAVVTNSAELSLNFNFSGGVIESGMVGLKYGSLLAFTATGAAKVTASGLPKGISLTNLGGGSYAFTGFTTKAGTYLVTVTATLKGKTVSQRIALKVDGLPTWAKGTYNGLVIGSTGTTNGLATVSVTSAGKISGKFYEGGTNWTLSAACYADYDEIDEEYTAPVTAQYSYKVKSGKKYVTKYVKRQFTLTVKHGLFDGVERGFASLAEEGGLAIDAWQNLWGSTYKAVGKRLFTSKSGKKAFAYRTFAIKSGTEWGDAIRLIDKMTLSLKVTTAGAVTATMTYNTGKMSKGKAVYYKPSCATAVIPTSVVTADKFTGKAYVYFAASPKNAFDCFVACVPIEE